MSVPPSDPPEYSRPGAPAKRPRRIGAPATDRSAARGALFEQNGMTALDGLQRVLEVEPHGDVDRALPLQERAETACGGIRERMWAGELQRPCTGPRAK